MRGGKASLGEICFKIKAVLKQMSVYPPFYLEDDMIPFYKNLFTCFSEIVAMLPQNMTDNKQVVLQINNLPKMKNGNRDVIVKCRPLSAQVVLCRVSHIFPLFAVALVVWPSALMSFGARR